jgi:glycine/D-amino acid oxidase-like deaminating enzyme
MEGSRRGPVVVVGAGIMGCAIAVHLADQGIRPVMVDLDRPRQGASASSFASLSAFGKDPAAYYELACAGMASWPRWAERLGGGVGLRRDGEVRWASDPEEGCDLAERVAHARSWGYPIRLVGEEELGRLIPAADPSAEHAQALLAQAARFFPALAGVPVRRRIVAWRAMSADRLPIVGPVPWLDSLYLAVTHSGVTVAPALGRLVAQEVAAGEPDGLLASFRPGRFAERATRVLLEVESVFRERPHQDPSL